MESEDEHGTRELTDYARTIWRQRWLILATVVIAVGAAAVFSSLQTAVYEATADVIVRPSAIQSILNPSTQNASTAARDVRTETDVLKSSVVEDAAKSKLGHRPDVNVSSNSANSDVVRITARSSRAHRAAADANGYTDAYLTLGRKQTTDDLNAATTQMQTKINQIEALLPTLRQGSPELTATQQQLSSLQQQLQRLQVSASLDPIGRARLLARADVPSTPVQPKTLRNVAISFALGLALGIGLALLREYLHDANRPREDLDDRSTSTG